MKKIVLTLVAVMSLTMSFAADTKNNANAEQQAYNMTLNYERLGAALNLTPDQIDEVKDIHKNFCAEMMSAANASKADKQAMIDKAVEKDLKHMSYVLTGKQMQKYELILTNTLRNRGLMK